MQQIYDKAHELAKLIHESEEYTTVNQLKELLFEDALNKQLYDQYKQTSLAVSAAYMQGEKPSEKLEEEYNQLMSMLSLNAQMTDFIMAEFRLNQLLGDLFKIIGDAADIQMGD